MACELFTPTGKRKYLTAADRARRPVRTLCYVLAYTGCRLSEALALTTDRVDFAAGALIFETLKKRRAGVYRAVPVPPAVLDRVDMVHGVREAQKRGKRERLWPWGRTIAWRHVKATMKTAEIPAGPHTCAKGLRHGFGVHAINAGVPLNLLSKWMGHASIETTAIYADAVGAEEQKIAERMWA